MTYYVGAGLAVRQTTGGWAMARAIWTGTISFGLVNVPVKMYTATRSKDIRFNQLHVRDGSRIQVRRFCAAEGIEVPPEEIVRGYEIRPGEYVTVTEDELAALAPELTEGIEIQEFIELREIDPVYFEHSYYLVPDKGGQKAYALLRQAMEQAKRVALGRVVMRGREYLTAIRAAGPVLVMSTLYYADEVVSVAELEGLPGETVQATEREVAMAQQLIEALAAPFEPEKYRDEYREAVLQLIEEKAAGKTVVPMAPKRAEAAPPVDLVKALEESIALAKERAKRTA